MLTLGSGKSSSRSSPKTELESVHLKIPMLYSLFSHGKLFFDDNGVR
jgi:hypothetical protein